MSKSKRDKRRYWGKNRKDRNRSVNLGKKLDRKKNKKQDKETKDREFQELVNKHSSKVE